VYGVPAWDHHPNPYLFWNQAHFEEVGQPADKPPATLDEARRLAEKMTKVGPDGINRLGFDPIAESGNGLLGFWANAYSVTWYDSKTRKLNLVQPGLVSALEYISGLYKIYTPEAVQAYRQKFPTFNSPNAGMPQGMESMKVSSGVSTGTLANNAPQIRVGIGWAPQEKARKTIQVGGGHFNCMSTGAPNADAAWRFVEWLTTPTANQLLMESVGWIAYNKDLGKSLDLKKFPNMRFVLDAPAKADQVTAPVVLPISLVPMEAGVQRVIKGQQGPREMLADVQKQLQNDLDEALKAG
jgi:ABC-type glycerol-3-phosphate transport system substrate-binding protein